MKKLIQVFKDNKSSIIQFIKFGIVGLSNTFIAYIVYAFLVFINLHYFIANIISFTVSVTNSFYWNKKYVFKDENKKIKDIIISYIKVYISYSFTGILLGNVLLYVFIDLLHISKYIAPLLGLIISVPLNFLLNKKWAFKQSKKNKEENII
ncbi:MAG: GtrA family protein [Treponema sp.]|nr:GtrA family protein [Treponema sp.]